MVRGADLRFNRSVFVSTSQQRVTVPTRHTQSKATGQKAPSGAADGCFHQPSLARPLVTACAAVRSGVSPSALLLLPLLPLSAPQTPSPTWLQSMSF